MKAKFLNLIAICLCVFLALSCVGCNSSKAPVSSDNSSSDTDVVDNNSEDSSSNEDDEITEDEFDSEDYFEEEYYEDEYFDYEDEESTSQPFEIKAKIANTQPISTKYMGSGSGVYFCFSYMKDDYGRNATDKQIKVEMDRLQNMGIHTVRTQFKFTWARDEKSPDGWNWESEDMLAVYHWLGELKNRNIDVMINPWSFEWLYNGETSIPDTDYFRADNFTENSTRWCNAVAELFKQLRSRGYTNAKYLVLFTEPIPSKNKSDDANNCYVENAKRLHTTLKNADLRNYVKIVGPNRSDDDTELLEKCINEADEAFDIYTQHRYLKSSSIINDMYYDDALIKYEPFVNTVKSSKAKNKPFWLDEFNVQDASISASNIGMDNSMRGLQMAVGITAAMNLGADNVILWTLADQQWTNQDNTAAASGFNNGVLEHGLFNNIQLKAEPKSQYYSYSLLSKYCGRNNGKTYLAKPYEDYEYLGVTLGCVETSDGNWTIIITNNNTEEVKITVDIEKTLGGAKLYRHQYLTSEDYRNIAAQIIPANKTFKNVTTGFTDVLRPASVAVYTTIKG